MKKLLSAVLALVMIFSLVTVSTTTAWADAPGEIPSGKVFAGYYTDDTLTVPSATETEYLKFVDENVLTAKYQLILGDGEGAANEDSASTKIRVVTTVDSLHYKAIGFHVWINDVQVDTNGNEFRTTRVARTIKGTDGLKDFQYTPDVFSSESVYFCAYNFTLSNAKFGAKLTFQPYWITQDNTEVTGNYNGNGKRDIVINESESFNNCFIGSASELLDFATASQSKNYEGWKIKLTKDIDLNPGWTASATAPDQPWTTQIGSSTTPFAGTFDGDGHTISGVYRSATTVNNGLFGVTAATATVKDFRLENSYFKSTATDMGSIAGIGNGTFENIYSNATVVASASNVGGMIGSCDGSAATSYTGLEFAGSVTGSGWRNGGIVGRVVPSTGSLTISDCITGGSVTGHKWTGGLVGNYAPTNAAASLTIQNSKNGAAVSINNSEASVGGLVGGFSGSTAATLNIDGCWNEGAVSGYTACAGILGEIDLTAAGATSVHNCLNSGSITASFNSTTSTKAEVAIGGLAGRVTAQSASAILNIGAVMNVGAINIADNAATTRVGFVIGDIRAGTITPDGKCYAGPASKGTNIGDYQQLAGGQWSPRNTFNNHANVTGGYESNAGRFNGYMPSKWLSGLDYTNNWALRKNTYPVPAALAETRLINPDRSWYLDHQTDTEFTLTTAEQLAGLAFLSEQYGDGETFDGKTIRLGADIILNDGDSATWGEAAPTYEWLSMFYDRTFAGTFDGDGHTISGMYVTSGGGTRGLFAKTAGTVQNLRLENGYITLTGTRCGTVAAEATGTIQNVYSNVNIVATNTGDYAHIGGIVGYSEVSSTISLTVSNCWYDGTLTSKGKGNGGIVATVSGTNGNATIAHCLNTSDITASQTASRTGGICGQVTNANAIITDTLSAGSLTLTGNENQAGTIVGIINGGTPGTVTVQSVFHARESFAKPTGQAAGDPQYANVSGVFHGVTEKDRFIGYFSDYSDYTSESTADLTLDYTNYWALSKSGTPVLRSLADPSDLYTVTDANTELCLTYWDDASMLIGSAVDCGGGSYRLMITDAAAGGKTHSGYVAALKSAGFTCVENTLDGQAYNATCTKDEWTVSVIHTGGSVNTTYVVFSTNQTVSANLRSSAADLTAVKSENKLHMLDMEANGNSMIVELKNGHYIVYDGGQGTELSALMTYLKDLAGKTGDVQNPVVIDAWILSHLHSDHAGAFGQIRKYGENAEVRGYLEDVSVQGVYLNEPNDAVKGYDTWTTTQGNANNTFGAVRFLSTTAGDRPNVYRMEAGQTYYFGDITVDVVLSQELASDRSMYLEAFGGETSTDFNDTSTWLKLNISGKTVLLAADGNTQNMDYLMQVYSAAYLSADVFQAPHHASNTYDTFTDYCTRPSIVLVENKYDPTTYTNGGVGLNSEDYDHEMYPDGPYQQGARMFSAATINANRRLVGLDTPISTDVQMFEKFRDKFDLTAYDTAKANQMFYLDGNHTVLTFTGSGVATAQVAK